MKWFNRIYPTERQLNKASDTEALDFNLKPFKSNGTVSTKTDVKRDDFDFDLAIFHYLDGNAPPPRPATYLIHILTYSFC